MESEVRLYLSTDGVWADLVVVSGAEALRVEGASDITDIVGDIVRAALAIVTGAGVAGFVIMFEPGASWISFDYDWREGPPRRLRLQEFELGQQDALGPPPPESRSATRKLALTEAHAFGSAVIDMVERLDNPSGGEMCWNWTEHRRPDRAIAALRAALAVS